MGAEGGGRAAPAVFPPLPVKAHIVSGRIAGDERESERIRTIPVYDIKRVDAVAQRL